MTKPRAVLHIGTMKTGTSTLQDTLVANGPALASVGYRYLGWPMRTSKLIARQLAKVPSATDIIVSDEGLWHFCGTAKSDSSTIAHLLRKYEITIVVYFRRPDAFIEAWFAQGMKTGTGTDDIINFLGSGFVNSRRFSERISGPRGFDSPEFCANIDLALLHKLTFFSTVFPTAKIVVRPYERAQMAGGDIVDDFLTTLGIGDIMGRPDFQRPPSVNMSPNADLVMIAALLRRGYHVPPELIKAFVAEQSAASTGVERASRVLTYREATAINDAMRPTFRKVQERWGGGSGDEFFVGWDLDPDSFCTTPFRDVFTSYQERDTMHVNALNARALEDAAADLAAAAARASRWRRVRRLRRRLAFF